MKKIYSKIRMTSKLGIDILNRSDFSYWDKGNIQPHELDVKSYRFYMRELVDFFQDLLNCGNNIWTCCRSRQDTLKLLLVPLKGVLTLFTGCREFGLIL